MDEYIYIQVFTNKPVNNLIFFRSQRLFGTKLKINAKLRRKYSGIVPKQTGKMLKHLVSGLTSCQS